jgi:hypothetical protein
MTPEVEKQMLDLLKEIKVRLERVETDVKWLRKQKQEKADRVAKMADDVLRTMPRFPK